MLVAAPGYNLAQAIDEVIPRLPMEVAPHFHRETHAAAVELSSSVHTRVDGAIKELRTLRHAIRETCEPLELQVASSGTHPFAVSREISVSRGERQAAVYGSMRELARREPTFALHVHVGFDTPEHAIRTFNRMRVHLPMLLALSAKLAVLAWAATPAWPPPARRCSRPSPASGFRAALRATRSG